MTNKVNLQLKEPKKEIQRIDLNALESKPKGHA